MLKSTRKASHYPSRKLCGAYGRRQKLHVGALTGLTVPLIPKPLLISHYRYEILSSKVCILKEGFISRMRRILYSDGENRYFEPEGRGRKDDHHIEPWGSTRSRRATGRADRR